MVLHGILGGSELVLRNHVILVVLEVTVRLEQARRRVPLVVSLASSCGPFTTRRGFGVDG